MADKKFTATELMERQLWLPAPSPPAGVLKLRRLIEVGEAAVREDAAHLADEATEGQ